MVRGDPALAGPVLVRVHSRCLTGDAFGAQRCDCGGQLDDALRLMTDNPAKFSGPEGYGLEIVERLTEGLSANDLFPYGPETVAV